MALHHPDRLPFLVYANRHGEILDFPGLDMAGRSGHHFYKPAPEDLIPLPPGSELFVLPDRLPVGIDPSSGAPVVLDHDPHLPKEPARAVAAFMAPAHTAIHTAAFKRKDQDLPPLPLFAYTAVGWYKERFWVAAFRSDPDCRQDADQFNDKTIRSRTKKRLRNNADNRLIQHLGKCCLTYGCPAARNYFLGRWEAPLPTSPACNAGCLGCISLQPSGCCPATQDRIKFIPRPHEIGEVAIPHLKKADRPVVSFGQGCEGEPLLQAATLEKAIRLIRSRTDRGTINLNTNASRPEALQCLVDAGLDSMRVSMNSARPELHHRYYRPRDFSFREVRDSIATMKRGGRFVSLNYFILPGFTDDPEEFDAFCQLIEQERPDLIQLRNLNMDPDWYLDAMEHRPGQPPIGMRTWLATLRQRFPWLQFGYFNPFLGTGPQAENKHSVFRNRKFK